MRRDFKVESPTEIVLFPKVARCAICVCYLVLLTGFSEVAWLMLSALGFWVVAKTNSRLTLYSYVLGTIAITRHCEKVLGTSKKQCTRAKAFDPRNRSSTKINWYLKRRIFVIILDPFH